MLKSLMKMHIKPK